MNLDDIDLERPEPLEEIDPDAHAAEFEDAPGSPAELEDAPAMPDTRRQQTSDYEYERTSMRAVSASPAA